MTRGNSRWKIIVHYVKTGKYASKRTDVVLRFVAWKTNVPNAK
jgi:hypothetical protein